MALFGSGKNQRPSAQYEQRRSNSSQQQRYQNERELREQRVKSRNRLVGSVILVLAAIVILPMILKTSDDTTTTETTAPLIAPGPSIGQSGLVVESSPGVQTPTSPEVSTEATAIGAEGEDAEMPLAVAENLPEGEDHAAQGLVDSDVSIAESTAALAAQNEAAARERAEQEAARAREEARQQQARAEQQKQQAAKAEAQKPKQQIAESKRTDDGSRALAILEGRTPPAPKRAPAPAASGSGEYSLQVASYRSANDARAQRDRLRGSGVSNAYIQSATVNGNQVFRLRVGPFSSKEAAQAAQTRLRALNFSDSFVTGH
ncbi:MAG: SPOR domain-containing protein [Alcaligenaceae bacterium]|jgi:DedD protein|nr:SPOR domain-containing protein [Alcaligenaceae bacterium]